MTMFRSGVIAAALTVLALSPMTATAQSVGKNTAPVSPPMSGSSPEAMRMQSTTPAQMKTKRMGMTSSGKSMSSTQRVTNLQTKLNATGAALKVDGRMGSQTRAAIATFQRTHGLEANGQMNRKTREKLRGV